MCNEHLVLSLTWVAGTLAGSSSQTISRHMGAIEQFGGEVCNVRLQQYLAQHKAP